MKIPRIITLLMTLALATTACSSGSKEETATTEAPVTAQEGETADSGSSDSATDTTEAAAEEEAPCPTEGLETVKVAVLGIYTDAAIEWADRHCYFGNEGISVEVSVVPNPPASVAALVGGEVDVAYSPTIPIVRAYDAGAPVLGLAAADGYDQASIDAYGEALDDTAVFVAQAIESPKDLEGKTVAVPARGAQLEVTTADAVLRAGGDPAKVNFVALDLPNMVDALKAGEIDAASLVSPFTLQAKEAGLIDSGITAVDFFGPGAVGVWTTSVPAMEEKGDALRAFRNAIHKANAEASANPEEFWVVASEVTGVELATLQANGIAYVFPTELAQNDFDKVAVKLQELGFLEGSPDLSAIIAN